LEQKYSRFQPNTITSRINAAAGTGQRIPLDIETHQLFLLADQAYCVSGGLFDITSGILRQVWDFRQQTVPSSMALAQVLPRIGWSQVELRQEEPRREAKRSGAADDPDGPSGWSVLLPQVGMEIDFGGLVKEYAADAAATALREAGIQNGFVDLGGDLSVIGPHPTQGPWPIGVRDPRATERAIGHLKVGRGSVATSGDYERFFEQNGRRYCHILDPTTGWPCSAKDERGFASVTVVTQPCVVAGIAATVALLKGAAQGLEWLQELGVPFFAVTAPFTDVVTGITQAPKIFTERSTPTEIAQSLGCLTS
jgi:thiamine biosynthesis lipoprotein